MSAEAIDIKKITSLWNMRRRNEKRKAGLHEQFFIKPLPHKAQN